MRARMIRWSRVAVATALLVGVAGMSVSEAAGLSGSVGADPFSSALILGLGLVAIVVGAMGRRRKANVTDHQE